MFPEEIISFRMKFSFFGHCVGPASQKTGGPEQRSTGLVKSDPGLRR